MPPPPAGVPGINAPLLHPAALRTGAHGPLANLPPAFLGQETTRSNDAPKSGMVIARQGPDLGRGRGQVQVQVQLAARHRPIRAALTRWVGPMKVEAKGTNQARKEEGQMEGRANGRTGEEGEKREEETRGEGQLAGCVCCEFGSQHIARVLYFFCFLGTGGGTAATASSQKRRALVNS